jgi:hypothetical protein
MPTKPRRRVAVQEKQTTEARAPAPSAAPARPAEIDGLWGIAMLRVAMELKRPGAPGLDQIVEGVATRMGIPKAEFEQFLAENYGVLTQAARDRGYAP